MTFDAFRAKVHQALQEFPERFLEGLDAVHVFEFEKRDPNEPGLVRLGEYLDPGPDQFLGPGVGIGRHIALYYGSFARIALGNAEFDWEDEIWHTLTHELQHHLESRAGEISLIEEDLAFLQAYRKHRQGQRQ